MLSKGTKNGRETVLKGTKNGRETVLKGAKKGGRQCLVKVLRMGERRC